MSLLLLVGWYPVKWRRLQFETVPEGLTDMYVCLLC